jgi:Holliday junction resolvase RusA-like endonuclease
MITADDEKVWDDMERDKRDTDNVIYGSIDQLKKTICSFLDFTITRLDGERKTSSKETKNGELIIKIEDVFQSRPSEEGKKLTYFMKIDPNQEEEPKREV